MKFLIAGLGSIGRRHLRNLIALGEKDIVLFRTRKSTMPEEDLGGFPQETDLLAALEKHKPDAVIIANPTAVHLDVAIPAAQAGCSLLLEKPLSHSLERIDQLEAALTKGGGRAMVGFQFRYHPGLMRAKQLITDGGIGRVISAHVHFGEYLPAWHPWEDYRKGYAARADMGGGVVLTQCHSLDYLPWLVGDVESVWAFTAKLSDLDVDVEDTAKIGLRFSKGALGSIHLDYNEQPPAHYFEIIGTKGSLQWDQSDGTTHIYRASSHPGPSPEGRGGNEKKGEGAWEAYPPPAEFERNVMFMEEMKHFVKVACGEVESNSPLEAGIRVQRLIEAIHRSNKTRMAVNV